MPGGDERHHTLIDQLIARGALWSPALVASFRATPRQHFLDRVFLHRQGRWQPIDADSSSEYFSIVYSDRAVTTCISSPADTTAVPVSSSSQPSLMAQMLEDLDLTEGLRMLEIGAGTGYNAALLSHIVGPILSVDIDRAVVTRARVHLRAFPDRPVRILHADGRLGYPEGAPWDRIQVTAATDRIEPAWREQLAPGGILQAPLDLAPGLAWLVQGTVEADTFVGRLTRAAYFMPLRDEYDPGRDRNHASGPVPGPERLAAVAPPWSSWQDGRGYGGSEYLPSLAFLAWLEGFTLAHSTSNEGRAIHGIADLVRGNVCWMGSQEWWVSGIAGETLGRDLWRRWLDLGAPRPTEWRIQIASSARHVDTEGGIVTYIRPSSETCRQVWDLPAKRRRAEFD